MKPPQHSRFIPQTSPLLQIPTTHLCALPNLNSTRKCTLPKIPHPRSTGSQKILNSTQKNASLSESPTNHLPYILKTHLSTQKDPPCLDFPATHLQNPLQTHLRFTLMAALSLPLPSFAAETKQISDKINLESIVISVDDFFNRNPFFVAGLAFIWLVVAPLTQEYLKKYKYISSIDAFRKLRDGPNSQLLDIRKEQSVKYLNSPNLKILNKNVAHVEFVEGEEEGFLKEVLEKFGDPGSTIICVLDNFDGYSLKVAELLFKQGFKEAYAIQGGIRGKDGWQAIQETFLPPSVHVHPRKKKSKSSVQFEDSRELNDEQNNGTTKSPTASLRLKQEEKKKPIETELANGRPLSPYPKYPDLKPPSSPTPSKPQN